MRIAVLVILGLLSLISCAPTTNKAVFTDSVLKHHMMEISKLPYYDTNTLDYKLLKAVYGNDTAYLNAYLKSSAERDTWEHMKLYNDTVLHLPALSALGADEAYRFTHEDYGFSLFYDTSLVNLYSITITKKEEKIRLQSVWLEYHELETDGSWPFKINYNIKFRQDTVLKLQYWDSLKESLRYNDYWGLQSDNDSKGKDGSATTIDAYIKPMYDRPARSKHVYRYCIYDYPINNTVKLVQRLSGRRPNGASSEFHP